MYFKIIVLDELKPSSLPHIRISLCEDVLETLMVSVNIAMGSHKMMPPYLESMDNCC
jgi:hypothetical protein